MSLLLRGKQALVSLFFFSHSKTCGALATHLHQNLPSVCFFHQTARIGTGV